MCGDARSYDETTRAQALLLLQEGQTIRAVAATMEVSTSTVLRWKKQGLSPLRFALAAVEFEVPPIVRKKQNVAPPSNLANLAPQSSPPDRLITSDEALAILEQGGEVSAADLMRGIL